MTETQTAFSHKNQETMKEYLGLSAVVHGYCLVWYSPNGIIKVEKSL